MNANLQKLNGGKAHQPIYKVRVYEHASKFAVGSDGNKKDKYVEAAKGTNLYFAIYSDEAGKRSFDTIPLNIVIERLKEGLCPVPEQNLSGDKLLFHLSPNDLVYVPTEEDIKEQKTTKVIEPGRIYKVVSCTGNELHCIPQRIASPILLTKELGSNNKAQRAWTDEMIKEICLPLKVDRLGNVTYIGTEFLPKRGL
jgi:CRISPR-associated endonuclease Csn1